MGLGCAAPSRCPAPARPPCLQQPVCKPVLLPTPPPTNTHARSPCMQRPHLARSPAPQSQWLACPQTPGVGPAPCEWATNGEGGGRGGEGGGRWGETSRVGPPPPVEGGQSKPTSLSLPPSLTPATTTSARARPPEQGPCWCLCHSVDVAHALLVSPLAGVPNRPQVLSAVVGCWRHNPGGEGGRGWCQGERT